MPYNKNIVGWMSEGELKVLEMLAEGVPENGVMVELGSLFGRSTVCWAMSCLPSVKIYCIDVFPESIVINHTISQDVCELMKFPTNDYNYNSYELFLENTKEFKNIIPIRGRSPDLVSYNSSEIDLFFLDALHSNPNDWDNIKYYLPLIKKGGIICGHDYNPMFPDVIENVNRLEVLLGKKVTRYFGASVWSFVIDEPVKDVPSFT